MNTNQGTSQQPQTNQPVAAPPQASSKGAGRPKRSPEKLGEYVEGKFVPILATVRRGKPVWLVRVSGTGKKRKYKSFRTLEEARAFARAFAVGLRQDASLFVTISPAQIKACCLVAERLGPFCQQAGIGLERAIQEYLAAKECVGCEDLRKVVNDYLSQPWIAKSRTPCGEALEAFIAARADRGSRPATLRHLSYFLGKLVNQVEISTPIGDITSLQLEEFIHDSHYGQRTKRSIYDLVHFFYDWLSRNGYIRLDRPNALDAVGRPKADKLIPPVADVPTVRRLILALATHPDPEYLLMLLLGLFAGLRGRDFANFTIVDDFGGKMIRVTRPDSISKLVSGQRVIPIGPTLDAWLSPFYGRSTKLMSRNDPLTDLRRALKTLGCPWNAAWLRNNYCSFRYHHSGRDLLVTSRESGITPDVLAKTFANRVTPNQAADYFALTPGACGVMDWDQRVADHYSNQNPERLAA